MPHGGKRNGKRKGFFSCRLHNSLRMFRTAHNALRVFLLAKFVTFFSPPINRLRPATNFPEPSPFFLLNAPRLKKKSGFQKNFSPDFLAYGRRNITTPKGQGKNSKRYAVDDNIPREKHKADMRRRR